MKSGGGGGKPRDKNLKKYLGDAVQKKAALFVLQGLPHNFPKRYTVGIPPPPRFHPTSLFSLTSRNEMTYVNVEINCKTAGFGMWIPNYTA